MFYLLLSLTKQHCGCRLHAEQLKSHVFELQTRLDDVYLTLAAFYCLLSKLAGWPPRPNPPHAVGNKPSRPGRIEKRFDDQLNLASPKSHDAKRKGLGEEAGSGLESSSLVAGGTKVRDEDPQRIVYRYSLIRYGRPHH